MVTNAKRKTLSDEICIAVLSSIRFSPYCPRTDRRTEGIHGNGLGGLGYRYWRSPKLLELNRRVRQFRLVSDLELSNTEVEDFISSYIDYFINPMIAGRFELQIGSGSLLESLEREEIDDLQSSFFEYISEFFNESQFWLPLGSVHIDEYSSQAFSLVSKERFESSRHGIAVGRLGIRQQKNISSFLGVKARNRTRALEKSSSILGSLMLCMHNRTHFGITMGESVSDIYGISHGVNMSPTQPHVPPLSEHIYLQSSDFIWLDKVSGVILDEISNRKFIRALRWIKSSWFLKGAERFTAICQALDAVTPSKFSGMAGKCKWAYCAVEADIDEEAIDILFKKLRSDVIHGDAPSLIESSHYLNFLERYDVDPLHAAFELVRRILVRRFLPEIIIRENPLLNYPNALRRQSELLARYGLEFTPSPGFDFSALRVSAE